MKLILTDSIYSIIISSMNEPVQKKKQKIPTIKKEYVQTIYDSLANQKENHLLQHLQSQIQKNVLLDQFCQENIKHNSSIMGFLREKLRTREDNALQRETQQILQLRKKELQLSQKLIKKDEEVEQVMKVIEQKKEQTQQLMSQLSKKNIVEQEMKNVVQKLMRQLEQKNELQKQMQEQLKAKNEMECNKQLITRMQKYFENKEKGSMKICRQLQRCNRQIQKMRELKTKSQRACLDSITQYEQEEQQEYGEIHLPSFTIHYDIEKTVQRLCAGSLQNIQDKVRQVRYNLIKLKENYKEEIKAISDKNEELLDKVYELEQQKIRNVSVINNNNANIEELTSIIYNLRSQISQAREEKLKLQEQNNNFKTDLQQIKEQLSEKNKYFEKCQQILEQKNKKQSQLQAQITQLQNNNPSHQVKFLQSEMSDKNQLIQRLIQENKRLKKDNEDIKYMNQIFKKDAFKVQELKEKNWDQFICLHPKVKTQSYHETKDNKSALNNGSFSKISQRLSTKNKQNNFSKKVNTSFALENNLSVRQKKHSYHTPMTQKLRSKYSIF